jgi:TolA-binding protein
MLRRSLLVVLPILALAGCATKRDVRDVQTTLQELYAQQQALVREIQRQLRANQDTLGMLVRQQQDTQANLAMRLARIEDHVLLLQELQGVSQQQLAQLRDQVERNRTVVQAPPPVAQSDAPGGSSSGSAEEVFAAGMTEFNRGNFSTARYAFEDFVERFPGHAQRVDARFQLAMILAEEDRPAEAIEAFRSIQEYHPTSERVPESRLKMAVLYLQLGNREAAEAELDRIQNTWPDTEAAATARQMRETLR